MFALVPVSAFGRKARPWTFPSRPTRKEVNVVRRAVTIFLAAFSLGGGGLVAVAEPASARPENARISDVRPLRRETDGRVDSLGTIAKLKLLHVDYHMFGIGGKQDWDDLRVDFAPAAQRHGIKVWVYLRSPSSCGSEGCEGYLPYQDRYEDWGEAVAHLSKQYPVVLGWSIDDFANSRNLETHFTPAKMQQIRQAYRAIQPTLEFYPVVYYQFITQWFVDNYAPVMDALIMPYRDGLYRNTAWTGSLTQQLNSAVSLLAGRSRKLILMVYALNLSETEIAPDVQYVRSVTSVAMSYLSQGRIGGVVHYGLDLRVDRQQRGDWNYSHGSGRGALAFVLHPQDATSAGDYVAAGNAIRFNPGSNSCQVRVRHIDNRGTTAPKGYHFIQVLASGRIMWEQDVAADDAGENGWHVTPWLDITSRMSGGDATLTLRLYDQQAVGNMQVRLRFDDIETVGCHVANPSFESPGGWTLTRSDGPLHGAVHLYDPVYTTTVFDLVADMFAP
jgi:hypothetical protein